ncbi:hypothetical protein BJ917_0308 [Pseudomonas sp. WPR_5_2]|nr:hypothetical protein BJ917_0308 [Pseudomonas sp. WPR_5_2]
MCHGLKPINKDYYVCKYSLSSLLSVPFVIAVKLNPAVDWSNYYGERRL